MSNKCIWEWQEDCSDNNPCKECLDWCNVFEIELSHVSYEYLGQFVEFKGKAE